MHWVPLKVLWARTPSRNYELAASMRKHRLSLLMHSVICKQQLLTRENERKTQSSARCYCMSVIYSAMWSMMRTKSPISSGSHNVSEKLWEHLASCPTQRLPPSRKNQDLFLLASTRNNAKESAVASHYFFNERTKAVLQSQFDWLGRNTLVSSWISCDKIIQHSLKWLAVRIPSPLIYLLETHTHMGTHMHMHTQL